MFSWTLWNKFIIDTNINEIKFINASGMKFNPETKWIAWLNRLRAFSRKPSWFLSLLEASEWVIYSILMILLI